jgi:hypothetical protein
MKAVGLLEETEQDIPEEEVLSQETNQNKVKRKTEEKTNCDNE